MDLDPDLFMDYDCTYMDQDQTWITLWNMWFVIFNFFVWVLGAEIHFYVVFLPGFLELFLTVLLGLKSISVLAQPREGQCSIVGDLSGGGCH